jgi:hypothetical protein
VNECRRNMSSSLSGQVFEDTGANTPTVGGANPRSRKKHSMRRYLFAATTAAFLLLTGTAAAQPGQDDPVSGDDRATAYPGNVVAEKDCATLYEGSEPVAEGDITHSTDGTETYLDITAVADGVEIAAVIVKGSDAYNEYLAGDLGELPWEDLHAPLASSGKPAQISHWFACGGEDTTTTTTETTTTTTESTTSTTDTSTSTPPSSESSSSSSSSAAVTTVTTTSASVAVAADEDDLAFTGFSGGWLVLLAAVLLLGGGALLFVVRMRTGRR